MYQGILSGLRAKKAVKRTIKGYVNKNLLFAAFRQNEVSLKDMEDVKPRHIKRYVLFLSQTDHKPTYINGILKCIRIFEFRTSEEDLFTATAIRENRRACLYEQSADAA